VSVPDTRIDIRVPPDQRPAPKTAKLPEPPEREGRGDRDSNNVTQNNTFIGRDDLMMIFAVLGMAIGFIALALWWNTYNTMQLYEREIRLAQRDAQDAKNQVNTLKEVLEIVGLKVPKKEDDNEHQ
jgi:hypothetical protein